MVAWHNYCGFNSELFKNKTLVMPGRGDKNKHGSAGRGANNQSNQPFVTSSEEHSKSDHNKHHTGGKPSEPSPRSADPDANRNESLKESKKKQRD
jgi:hypothetical protein